MMVAAAKVSSVGVVLPLLGAVGIDPFRDGIAVDAEGFGGVRNSLLISREGLLNIELFKLSQGLIKHDVTIEHFLDNSF